MAEERASDLIEQMSAAPVLLIDQPKAVDAEKAEQAQESSQPQEESPKAPSPYDFLLLFGILVMLIWPWIFFGVVWAKKGIQMNNDSAKVLMKNPHATTYFVTLICSVFSMIITAFFSLAVVRFAQEFITRYKPGHFHITALWAIRRQTWPWGTDLKDIKGLMRKDKWLAVILVALCVVTFPNLVSTMTSLLTPISFNRNTTLVGTELDFSSTDSNCTNWFNLNSIHDPCDWGLYKGQYFSTCLGEIQLVDVLEAGRGKILELATDNSQSQTFSQLGAKDGLHFLGSIRGILPLGPDGVTVFDTLEPSPLSNNDSLEGILSYNYSLNYQGLFSKVNCTYQPNSAIRYGRLGTSATMQNAGSCKGMNETPILTAQNYNPIFGNNTFLYWACRSQSNDSYSVYLFGLNGDYQDLVRNITCIISPIQPEIIPVQYESTRRLFYPTGNFSNSTGSTASVYSSGLVHYALDALGDIIYRGQNDDSNIVAESVITFGIKSFQQKPHIASDKYLELFANMIQGIIEYETTYIRLIYSSVDDPLPPPSCVRQVTGSVSFEVFGWFVESDNIGYLVPLTLVNAAALVAIILALTHAKYLGYRHSRHSRTVPKSNDPEPSPDEWQKQISYQPISVFKETLQGITDNVKDGVMQVAKAAA